ncbi:unnamed protein product [Penicillium olsonii]|nr:unnamed protein product [Penicillium olsonii]CAG7934147.1 unnamed protein product [Penicillium olsonii]
MVATCVASSNLALSAALRHVYRSQLTTNLAAPLVTPYHARLNTHYPRDRDFRRPFSLFSRLRNTQNEPSELSPSNVSDSADITPSPRKDHKAFDGPSKGGWNTHRRQPKVQQKDSERKTGRSDRERRQFRNEKRREEKKRPRNWQEEKAKARQDFEKQKKRKPENWQVQKAALKQKFTGGWNPPKKLSPDALDGIRHLHAKAPEQFTTAVLAQEFEMSPEAIRRILKSRWRPTEDEMESRRKRWEKRHDRIWSRMSELGLRPANDRAKPLADYQVLYKEDNDRE